MGKVVGKGGSGSVDADGVSMRDWEMRKVDARGVVKVGVGVRVRVAWMRGVECECEWMV